MRDVEATLSGLDSQDVIGRIWDRDHTVWRPGPDEVADRLGWLDLPSVMRDELSELEAFAEEARAEGFRHVVLLGMGGSSLGPAVLGQSIGSAPGYPELIVLDSTIPSTVRSVGDAIDPRKTLFLVSSKSGGTVEPNVLYRHFRNVVEEAVGSEHAGHGFVAITDEGTPLENLANEQGFRGVFLAPPDMGGRYSVLSYFGMVPAALLGQDLARMLDRAERMKGACGPDAPVRDNPGARLGATMGAMAASGRDKLTLVTSPAIATFGLWAEQLIAESTGKEGNGIVPVAGEPLLDPGAYGDDRLFVYLRLEDDENRANDAAVAEIEASGQPVVRLGLRDRYDLGAEFFRWEFATSVVGSVLGINPFDQPDVELAKRQTERLLREYELTDRLADEEAQTTMGELLAGAGVGKYLSVMAFIHPTAAIERSLERLRTAMMRRYRIATTLGYGPRFLHSTGQLYKGGPENGLFLQLTAGHHEDLPVPGDSYTFGVLADAQALGDLMALRERGRRVARVHLGSDVAAEIERLAAEFGKQEAPA